MLGSAKRTSSLWFAVAIPRDERFVETVCALAARIAWCCGYEPADAQQMGSTVADAVRKALLWPPEAGTSGGIDVQFRTDAAALEVTISCAGQGDGAEADTIGAAWDCVEAHREAGRSGFRFARRLPPSNPSSC
jgi:hypothetical protein